MRSRETRNHTIAPGPGDEESQGTGSAARPGDESAGPGDDRADATDGRDRGHGPDRGDGPSWPRGGHRGWGPRGRARGAQEAPDATDSRAWLAGRLPDAWFVVTPDVTVDRDEILVVGTLPDLDGEFSDAAARAAAEAGRIARFREDTREQRMDIARQAAHRYGREVSWGARLGGTEQLFTTVAAPVMTRLRQPERQVLDTLVDSGVARSRADALAWAVHLVGEHADEWLAELRSAMEEVTRLRNEGPDLS